MQIFLYKVIEHKAKCKHFLRKIYKKKILRKYFCIKVFNIKRNVNDLKEKLKF